MGFALDFTENKNLDGLDSSNRIKEEGWFRSVCEDTYEDSQSGDRVFKFKILQGAGTQAYNGVIHQEKLWNPDQADNEEHRKSSQEKAKKWAKRFGLVDNTAAGKVVEVNWLQIIGQQFVLDIQAGKGKDKKLNGFFNVEYLGIYPLAHEKIPAAIRQVLGLSGPAPAPSTTPAATSRADPAASPAATPPRPAVDVSGL